VLAHAQPAAVDSIMHTHTNGRPGRRST
jgi:hypothetical protein